MLPASRRLRYRLVYLGFLLVAGLGRLLPLEWASALGGWCWRLVAPLTHRHWRAVANLRRAFPELTEEECERIARDMWTSLGNNFGESFQLDAIARSNRVTIAPAAHGLLQSYQGRGLVMAAAHQGNWEVLAIAAVREGLQTSGIYQKVKNPWLDAWLRDKRTPFYTGGLLAKHRKSGLQLIRHVQQGGCMAILADLRDYRGIKVPFFGHAAPTSTFPALVARTTGAPLIAWFCERLPGVRFQLSCVEVEVPHTDDKDADIEIATARLQMALEESIRKRPSQWMWGHRRWG